MGTNELGSKGNSEGKQTLINELEVMLSKYIVMLVGRFSEYGIIKYSGIDKKTVKEHKKKGEIPPKYFEQYMEALGKSNRPPKEVKEPAKEGKKLTLEEWKIFITIYRPIIYPALYAIYKEYKKIIGVGPYLKERVLGKGTSINNVVPEVLAEELEKSINSINERVKQHKVNELSPQFFHHLNICFDAFSTITTSDFLFLACFFRAKGKERKKIVAQVNKMALNSATDIISCLTSGSGKLWMMAYTHYSSNEGEKGTQTAIWKNFKKKIENHFSESKDIEDQKKELAFFYFLALIWPEEGETDTKFGPQEIEALIVFKYFLTEEARQNLLDELQIDYT